MLPDVTVIKRILEGAGLSATVEEIPILGIVCRISPEQARSALLALRDSELGFAFMVDLFGIDTGDAIDVVYHLRSLSRDEEVFIKAEHAYDAVLTSVWKVFPAAHFPERECAELFGLKLADHPNPKRLLTTDGVPPLLRKSVEIRGAEEVRNR